MHASLCDYLADIVQNAIEAGASQIDVEVTENETQVIIGVTDNGKGMDAATQARIWDPFYSEAGKHTHRRVGLGLPLLRQAVEATGGTLTLDSAPGRGTQLHFSLPTDHLDTPPLGDLPGTLLTLLTHDGDYNLALHRARCNRNYAINRSELQEVLGDLRMANNMLLTREFLRSQEDDLMNTNNAGSPDICHGTPNEG